MKFNSEVYEEIYNETNLNNFKSLKELGNTRFFFFYFPYLNRVVEVFDIFKDGNISIFNYIKNCIDLIINKKEV